ncbi:class I SAM-dependent methyltransferase [Paenibacillus gallinarum]|uniref:Class I SAM-dependent methyltransferase n=1 Tax=Paenibacillus gallinarum TaxID=2762232 RepID=A0ABR8T1C8_9BACL|nr:class I SAM-dependent methyltransferase [Paenibacillus gallinarum]MBD7969571.1 class I SAM-dependent methyltransferase [Paenibacillus gallinarum]
MKTSDSTYDVSKTSLGMEAELNRLKAQALMGWEKECRYLQWYGLSDGMNVLEVGCGPGYVTEQLIKNFPNSEITALDFDSALLQKAKENHNSSKVKYVQASVYDTKLPDDHYDFVIARLIFLHLFDPLKAALEIFRVLKPGGKVAIIDIDDGIFGIVEPNIESFHSVLDKLIDMQKKAGGNREIGRSLPRLLGQSGFSDIDLEAVSVHSDLVGLEGFQEQFNPKRFEQFFRLGILSENDFHNIEKAHDNLLHNPDSCAMMIFHIAFGTKPIQ